MIYFKRLIIGLFLLGALSLFSGKLFSQNIFDYENSKKYAYFLFSLKEYELAALEFDRIRLMLDEPNDTLDCMLIQSLRLSGNIERAWEQMQSHYNDSILTSPIFENEFIRLLLARNNYRQAIRALEMPLALNSDVVTIYTISTLLLDGDYKLAEEEGMEEGKWTSVLVLRDVVNDANNMRRVNPALAGSLSFILPGLGQTYAGNYKDGIFALIFTGSSAYQSYTGFEKSGIESFYGWTFAAIAASFYSANIYGAVKTANKHNKTKQERIRSQVEKILDNYYY